MDALPTHISISDQEALAAFKEGRGDKDVQTAAEYFDLS